jgi:hypothetical protein
MQIIRFLMWALLTFSSQFVLAQVEQAKGSATISFASSKATPEDKTRAFQQAQVKAVERYYAESGDSESANFDNVRDKVLENLDKFVLSSTLISEDESKDKKQYTAVVRIELNVAKLRNTLKANSAVGSTAAGNKSPLTFVFMARQVASVKSFDARRVERADIRTEGSATRSDREKTSESERVGRGSVKTSGAADRSVTASAQKSVTIETGGSTTQRSDDTAWRLIPAQNLNAQFTGIFAKAGFDVVEAVYVEPQSKGLLSVKSIERDYETGNDLAPETLRNTADGLKNAQIPYLALGTLDVGTKDTDPATGLFRVYVTVTGKIMDLTTRFPKVVSSVGPVQFAGTGPNEAVAQTNALKLAADNAARELVSQINNVGVR